MVDFYPNQPLDLSLEVLITLNLGIALILFLFAVSALARFLPDLPFSTGLFSRRKVLQVLLWKKHAGVFEPRVQVGDVGVARTILRPTRKAEFGAALVDVVTDGEFVDPGVKVRVRLVEGDRVLVEPPTHRAAQTQRSKFAPSGNNQS